MKTHPVSLISARYPDNAPHDQRSSPQVRYGCMAQSIGFIYGIKRLRNQFYMSVEMQYPHLTLYTYGLSTINCFRFVDALSV
jgi:hypothetical protein